MWLLLRDKKQKYGLSPETNCNSTSDLANVAVSLSLIAILSFAIVPISMLLRGHLLEYN